VRAFYLILSLVISAVAGAVSSMMALARRTLEELLKDGWEPFAVNRGKERWTDESSMIHEEDGYFIFLRRAGQMAVCRRVPGYWGIKNYEIRGEARTP
jgi:hypothetical protein